jgi:hypothetical protein
VRCSPETKHSQQKFAVHNSSIKVSSRPRQFTHYHNHHSTFQQSSTNTDVHYTYICSSALPQYLPLSKPRSDEFLLMMKQVIKLE